MLKFLLWFNVILKFFDCATTYYAVTRFSIEAEANPLVRFSMKEYGVTNTTVFVYLFSLFLFFSFYHLVKKHLQEGRSWRFGLFAFFAMAVLHFYIVVSNFYNIFQVL